MLGKSLGKMQDYDKLMWMSRGWERIFDEKTGYMHPRLKNGHFIENFDPMQVWRGFQEGNAVQYTFYVPHTPEELINKVDFLCVLLLACVLLRNLCYRIEGLKNLFNLACTSPGSSIIAVVRTCLRSGFAGFATSSTAPTAFTATAMDRTKTRDNWVRGM